MPNVPTQKDASACLKLWQRRLGLKDWTIHLGFYPSEEESFADCKAMSQYQTAYINLNLDRVKSHDILEKCIIHELIHCVLDPLTQPIMGLVGDQKDVLIYLEETVVTAIEKWPLWKNITTKH